jgi:hypothetical protein
MTSEPVDISDDLVSRLETFERDRAGPVSCGLRDWSQSADNRRTDQFC